MGKILSIWAENPVSSLVAALLVGLKTAAAGGAHGALNLGWGGVGVQWGGPWLMCTQLCSAHAVFGQKLELYFKPNACTSSTCFCLHTIDPLNSPKLLPQIAEHCCWSSTTFQVWTHKSQLCACQHLSCPPVFSAEHWKLQCWARSPVLSQVHWIPYKIIVVLSPQDLRLLWLFFVCDKLLITCV